MLTAAIAHARSKAPEADAPRLEIGRAYTDTFDLAQAIADRSLDTMFDAAPAIDHNGEVQRAALLLLAASSARQHLELQEVEYWELHFPFFGDSDTALVNLVGARASYGVLIASVEEQLKPGMAATTTFEAVRSSP
jgi:hypothetical protein